MTIGKFHKKERPDTAEKKKENRTVVMLDGSYAIVLQYDII